MADKRIMFDRDNVRFNYRVAGVAIRDKKVLLFRLEQFNWWALPGGRVEMMERSDTALQREMKEEIRVDVKIERLLWTMENFHGDKALYGHEINMFYLMALPQDCSLLNGKPYLTEDDGTPIVFKWVPLKDLEKTELYPSFLKKALLYMPKTTQHIIWQE